MLTEVSTEVNRTEQIWLGINKKAFPNAFANGIQGAGCHPVRLDI